MRLSAAELRRFSTTNMLTAERDEVTLPAVMKTR
jgi:hypothetical protein